MLILPDLVASVGPPPRAGVGEVGAVGALVGREGARVVGGVGGMGEEGLAVVGSRSVAPAYAWLKKKAKTNRKRTIAEIDGMGRA